MEIKQQVMKEDIDKQEVEITRQKQKNENLLDDITVWLPGYSFYCDDAYLRDLALRIQPKRKYDEFTEELKGSHFALLGDANRLVEVVSIRSQYQVKYEMVMTENEELYRKLDSLNERNKEYQKDINILRPELETLRRSQETQLTETHFSKIVDLESKMKDLKFEYEAKIQEFERQAPVTSEVSVQVNTYNKALGLLYGAKDHTKSYSRIHTPIKKRKKRDRYQDIPQMSIISQTSPIEQKITEVLRKYSTKVKLKPEEKNKLAFGEVLTILKE